MFIITFHLDAFAAKPPLLPEDESHAEAVRASLVSKCVIIVSFGSAPSYWVTL